MCTFGSWRRCIKLHYDSITVDVFSGSGRELVASSICPGPFNQLGAGARELVPTSRIDYITGTCRGVHINKL